MCYTHVRWVSDILYNCIAILFSLRCYLNHIYELSVENVLNMYIYKKTYFENVTCVHSINTIIVYMTANRPPPLATLALVKIAGGLYAGCDIFSRDYALSGCSPTTSCGRQRVWRLCSCYLEECYSVYMWQSRVEIVGHSVAYFDRIAVFKVSCEYGDPRFC